MGFDSIPSLEDAQFYLDLAFRRAKKSAQKGRTSLRDDKIEKSRKIEMNKLSTIKDILYSRLSEIVEEFPSFNNMTPFYEQLFKMTLDLDIVKKSLGSVDWAAKNVNKLGGQYLNKIKDAETIKEMNTYRKEFYGRISSIMNQIDDALHILLEARKVIIDFPVVKDMPTVAITGFPNVGKTTLLSKLTGSEPEIAAYAFTTKRLNLGYADVDGEEVQFIDTPGTLAREDKMNNIERLSYLAMRTTADMIVYVWDPTLQYTFDLQNRLFEAVKDEEKPIIHYVSKTDLVSSEELDEFTGKINGFVVTSTEELLEEVGAVVEDIEYSEEVEEDFEE